jgi:hypothetical protein
VSHRAVLNTSRWPSERRSRISRLLPPTTPCIALRLVSHGAPGLGRPRFGKRKQHQRTTSSPFMSRQRASSERLQ